MARLDPHSYHDTDQPTVAALDWSARVDFAARVLDAVAVLEFVAPALGGSLDLDTRDLAVSGVTDGDDRLLAFTLGAPDPVLGTRLRIEVPAGTRKVRIAYATAPAASALQWLTPAQ